MKRFYHYSVLFLTPLLISACTILPISPANKPSALDPRGPAAEHIASLWWVMLILGTAIFILVLGLLSAAFLRNQQSTSDTVPVISEGKTGRNWLIRGGIALPMVILSIVFGYTIFTLAAVENPQEQAAFHIQVVAKRWWWDVYYPDQGFKTANEIHIPVGEPVQLQLDSADVIHSFWVPELHGKMDVIPSHTNYITLQADHPGVFRGECAEFCGLQHATMGFIVVAQSKTDFAAWLTAQQQPATATNDTSTKEGQQVFLSAGCVFCHTVRGLDAKNINPSTTDLGPDLTHLSSRLMIAGATLTNNTNNLAGWVIDSQHIKQGSDMPGESINGQDLQALLTFLKSLH